MLKLNLFPFSIRCQTFLKFGATNLKNFNLILVPLPTLYLNNFKKKTGTESIIYTLIHLTFDIPKKNALERQWKLLNGSLWDRDKVILITD